MKGLRTEDGHTVSCVNERIFNMKELIVAANELVKFIKRIARDPAVLCQFDRSSMFDGMDRLAGAFEGVDDARVAYLAIEDFRRLFRKMGHSLSDLANREGHCLSMVVGPFVTDEFSVEVLSDYTTFLRVSNVFEEALASMDNIDFGAVDGLALKRVLCSSAACADLGRRYAVLVYRWASYVAKADGEITDLEADCLKSLVAMQSTDSSEFNGECAPGADGCGNGGTRENVLSTCEDPMAELDSLIGLQPVKQEVIKLAKFIQVQERRVKMGIKTAPISYHCVFTGNPGTGKTTVARILAGIYRQLGVLKKGHLVEIDRSGLVGGYVGQTAIKTNKVIDSALDGILFIDEAYSLVNGSEQDYGLEAIATLLKRMEDDRGRLVVVLAGYTENMQKFMDSNPGLQSRINRYIEFPDYSVEELRDIFIQQAKRNQYVLTDGAMRALTAKLVTAVEQKDKSFGNGRFVRNLFEKAIERQAVRVADMAPVTKEVLEQISTADVAGDDPDVRRTCPNCNALLSVPAYLPKGQRVRCPNCNEAFEL